MINDTAATEDTFGEDLIDFYKAKEEADKLSNTITPLPPIAALPKVIEVPTKPREKIKSIGPRQKPRKVKFGNLRSFVLETLTKLDEEWTEKIAELAWYDDLSDAGIELDDQDEDNLEKLDNDVIAVEAKIEVLIELGRYFGIIENELRSAITAVDEGYTKLQVSEREKDHKDDYRNSKAITA